MRLRSRRECSPRAGRGEGVREDDGHVGRAPYESAPSRGYSRSRTMGTTLPSAYGSARRARFRRRRRRPGSGGSRSCRARWCRARRARSFPISAMFSPIPSARSTSSIPLCTRRSEAMRRSFPDHCPSLRRTAGSSLGPSTTMPTIRSTMSSPKLKPNTRMTVARGEEPAQLGGEGGRREQVARRPAHVTRFGLGGPSPCAEA